MKLQFKKTVQLQPGGQVYKPGTHDVDIQEIQPLWFYEALVAEGSILIITPPVADPCYTHGITGAKPGLAGTLIIEPLLKAVDENPSPAGENLPAEPGDQTTSGDKVDEKEPVAKPGKKEPK